jgi:hypothetical protein
MKNKIDQPMKNIQNRQKNLLLFNEQSQILPFPYLLLICLLFSSLDLKAHLLLYFKISAIKENLCNTGLVIEEN